MIKRRTSEYRNKAYQQNWILPILIWLFTCWTVMGSSWNGDDWPNSQTPYWVLWRYGELNPGSIMHEALYWNEQWMRGQGRFYIFQWIESRFIFSYLRELWQYKLFETFILFLCGMIFVWLLIKIFITPVLGQLTLIFLACTTQFRYSFDPHVGFGTLVPIMLLKVLVSAVLVYHSTNCKESWKSTMYGVAAGLMYFISMSTYEYAFLLIPIFILVFIQTIYKNNITGEKSTNMMNSSFQLFSICSIDILSKFSGGNLPSLNNLDSIFNLSKSIWNFC